MKNVRNSRAWGGNDDILIWENTRAWGGNDDIIWE
jgi:hypothetical protein